MAIVATFAADFTDFIRETERAAGGLVKLQSGAGKIPVAMQQITSAGSSTSNALGGLHTSLNSVDRTLASLGVNIGPQVRALQELASASGKTASELGLISTAALTVAAGLGGWQVGTLISDFFGLEKIIGDTTATLLGWGDVASETAGAQADILAKASGEAGHQITSLTEAMAINEAAAKRFATETTAAAEAEKKLAIDTAKWREEVLKKFSDGVKAHNEEYRKSLADQEKADTAYRKFKNDMGEQEIKDKEAHLKWQEQQETAYRKLLNEIGEREIQDFAQVQKAKEEELAASLARRAALELASFHIVTQGSGKLDQRGNVVYGDFGGTSGGVGNITSFTGRASGGPVTGGQSYIVGEQGPELYTPGASGFITPNGGTVVNITVDARDSFYDTPDSIQRLANKVGQAVIAQQRSRGAAA